MGYGQPRLLLAAINITTMSTVPIPITKTQAQLTNEPMEKLRKKKVYTKFRSQNNNYITIPEIRLEGKWLKKLGFTEGKQIVIKQEVNKLTITLLP